MAGYKNRKYLHRRSLKLLAAHGTACPYCDQIMRIEVPNGPREPSHDHVIPKSVMPGMGTIIVCRECNMSKGNRTLDQWLDLLDQLGDPRAQTVARFMEENEAFRLDKASHPAKC